MMSRLVTIVVLLLALQQPRGAGTIEVTVRNDFTYLPLPDVQVQLIFTRENSRETAGAAITDAAGRAILVELPYGQYSVRFERSGYVLSTTSALVLDANRPTRQIEIALLPSSAIAGRVLNSDGDPLADVEVSAVLVYFPDGRRSLSRPQGGSGITARMKTNALGEFRLSGLRPGEYYIRADQADQLGKDQTRDGFPRLFYYPGVIDSAAAASIKVRDEDVTGVDIKVPDVPVFKISGTVLGAVQETDARNMPYQAFYLGSSNPDDLEDPVLLASRASRGAVADETDFEIPGIPPGSYILYPLFRESSPGDLTTYSARRVPVIVDDHDVPDLRILATRGVEINGRVTVNGGGPQFDLGQLRLEATSVTPLLLAGGRVTAPLSEVSYGEFSLSGLVEDELYRLSVSSLPDNAFISDIRQGAISVLHDGVIRANATYGPVEVFIDTKGGGVDGVVLDATGQPVGPAVVVLIPPAAYQGNSLFYKRARIGATGVFALHGIAPGEYRLLAFPTLPAGAPERNEQFMTPYYAQGTPLTIRPGVVSEVELRLVRLQ